MEDNSTKPEGVQDASDQSSSLFEKLAKPKTLIALLVVSLVLVAAAAATLIYISRPEPPPFEPPDSLESLAQQYPELANILNDDKLGSAYKEFLLVYQTQGDEAAYKLAVERGLINDKDEIRLTLELDTTDQAVIDSLKTGLEASGFRITAMAGNLIDLAIPLDVMITVLEQDDPMAMFGDLEGLEHVVRIRLPSTIQGKHLPAGSLNMEIESLSMIGADSWHSQGFTGQGVKVGVLDLEFDGYQSLLGTDLPDSVVAQCFCDGGEVDQMGGVHGTAVAEIIHDIAPDAELYLAAFQTDAEFQQAANWLADQGVKIISNSTGSNFGPKDGTSFSNRVIDDIVNRGVLWVNSAGNAAEGHYRAEFTDRDGDGWHDELIYFDTSGSDSLTLNWNAWSQGDQDYDLFIYDENNNLLASSQDAQSGVDSPSAEYIRLDAGDNGGRFYAAIQAARTTDTYILDFFTNNGTIQADLMSKESSLDDEATARLGLSIGAVYWGNDELESYSSQGPANDGRLKPDLSAPSVVSVESYGTEGFNGTSAATPHVSGAAALVLSAAPNFSVEQLKNYLFENAIDLGDSGPDNQFGHGRLFLGDIPQNTVEITPATPAAVTPAPGLTPAQTAVAGLALATPTNQLTATPEPVGGVEVNGDDALLIVAVLGVLGCLGMAGLVLVVVVWVSISSKRKKAAAASAAMAASPAQMAAAQPDSPQPAGESPCPNCGRSNRNGAKFCSNCGFVL